MANRKVRVVRSVKLNGRWAAGTSVDGKGRGSAESGPPRGLTPRLSQAEVHPSLEIDPDCRAHLHVGNNVPSFLSLIHHLTRSFHYRSGFSSAKYLEVAGWVKRLIATVGTRIDSCAVVGYRNLHPLRKTISQWGAPLCIHLVWVTSMVSLNSFAKPLAMPIANAHSWRGEL